MLNVFPVGFQQLDQHGLTLFAIRIFRHAQMCVGNENGVALYGNGMVEQHSEEEY